MSGGKLRQRRGTNLAIVGIDGLADPICVDQEHVARTELFGSLLDRHLERPADRRRGVSELPHVIVRRDDEGGWMTGIGVLECPCRRIEYTEEYCCKPIVFHRSYGEPIELAHEL